MGLKCPRFGLKCLQGALPTKDVCWNLLMKWVKDYTLQVLELLNLSQFFLNPDSNSRVSSAKSTYLSSIQLLTHVWLSDLMHCSMPGFPVHHQQLELALIHVRQVSGTIQPSHPLSSPSSPAFNISHHQGLFQCASSWHQVAKILEFQLQQQSFQ